MFIEIKKEGSNNPLDCFHKKINLKKITIGEYTNMVKKYNDKGYVVNTKNFK
jgi:hypothetical protein